MQRELKLIKIWLNTTKRWTMDKWDEFLGELGTKIKWKLLPPNSVNTTVTPRTTESNTTLRNETTDHLLSSLFHINFKLELNQNCTFTMLEWLFVITSKQYDRSITYSLWFLQFNINDRPLL
jgi:hypothetical protein